LTFWQEENRRKAVGEIDTGFSVLQFNISSTVKALLDISPKYKLFQPLSYEKNFYIHLKDII
jgi:hypothetical protein